MELNESENLILKLVEDGDFSDRAFLKTQRILSKQNKHQFITNDILLEAYHNLINREIIKPNSLLANLLKLKNTRSLSGIVVVSVLTKPFPCPGKCIYCPSEKDVPKSYLANEPAVMRALSCHFDPYLQVEARLKALEAVGHLTDKVNIRIIGGTWSYYPKSYQTWFVRRIFEAANNQSLKQSEIGLNSPKELQKVSSLTAEKTGKRLEELQLVNETAKHRIVEISVETRQDYIDLAEIIRLRKLGVTKVELGVQSIYDDVLKLNNRGNNTTDTAAATKLLKDAGFKVSYQMMLNLPGANLERDAQMFRELFDDERFKPDHLKIYPLALIKTTPLYQMYERNEYNPYTTEELVSLLKSVKSVIPYYCRVERVIRDIPAGEIVEGGAKVSNLRQIVTEKLIAEGRACHCVRCREIKSEFEATEGTILFREDYIGSGGKEIFLSYENKSRTKLYSMLRLRISGNNKSSALLENAGLIREIHTYGPQVGIGKYSEISAQHQGYGKKLILEAERIAKEEFDCDKVAVIAGVGVRGYFRKLGYSLVETYMIKKLKS
ncbi:MAG: tRNA uridine(34) 5-carboxymethylaminomethyl modification radical SAM/GNAT enzyme Elp3 [Candidatus Berkelbacteria bacterium]|nr:tRNA uridine(34) 5-carboxymethylaminomethyl modification radical SAM/GNAT enzyme Elp3 [Candidatus Berkelbacteria bacterium]